MKRRVFLHGMLIAGGALAGHLATDRFYIRFNSVIENIYRRMEALGVQPLQYSLKKHYMNAFCTHHMMGILSMGEGHRAVVGSDFKLRGTKNVLIVGGGQCFLDVALVTQL